MSILTIEEGGLIVADPNDRNVIAIDWDMKGLVAGVGITSSSFTITVVTGDDTTPLTKDNEDTLTAAEASAALQRTVTGDNRVTQLRLLGGTVGTEYQIDNQIDTDETPSQRKNRSFRYLIQDR